MSTAVRVVAGAMRTGLVRVVVVRPALGALIFHKVQLKLILTKNHLNHRFRMPKAEHKPDTYCTVPRVWAVNLLPADLL